MKKNAALARKVALSCRILAKLGLFKETTGHVSARNSTDQMLIRGRGPRETGLLFTKPSDVILADFEGQSQERKAGLKPPNEACIHGEIYKARAEVVCVVHAHPPSVVLCSMAGIELRPIYGGYDPDSIRLSLKGIPVYQSSLTLNTKDQVHAMQKVMGASDVCILRGHGLIVAGSSVEQATITASHRKGKQLPGRLVEILLRMAYQGLRTIGRKTRKLESSSLFTLACSPLTPCGHFE